MIVITGAGILSSLGIGVDTTLQALQSGACGIAPPRHLTTQHPLPVGEVPMSNAELSEAVQAASDVTSRTALMGIMALGEALQSAQLSSADLPHLALVGGTTVGNMDVTEVEFARTLHADTLGLCGMCTDQIAAHFGEWGYVTTLSTACSSAANAFIHGAMLIESGAYDCVVVGGSEALSRFHYKGFRSLLILDPDSCRPFDSSRAGLNLGEGAAFVVLERESHALARGVQPLATLSGWGNACDAFHQTASSEEGIGAVLAMQAALRRAGLQPADIGYINAHGTGTPNNDASELAAVRSVFPTLPPLSSTKSATGHTTSASGSVEAVICLLALQHHFLPANLHWSSAMDEDFTPVLVPTPAPQLRHVLCNAFAFGGNDTALVFSQYDTAQSEEQPSPIPAPRAVYLHQLLRPEDLAPEDLPKIPPMVARRLTPLLKRGLQVSLAVLAKVAQSERSNSATSSEQAATPLPSPYAQPQAIVVGTAMGCVTDTERFLRQLVEQGEEFLSPTHFIHSTHNTLAGLVAIHTKSHGYNTTFSQGDASYDHALRDAYLLLSQGHADNALVGAHDERNNLAVAYYLSTSPEGAICPILPTTTFHALCPH